MKNNKPTVFFDIDAAAQPNKSGIGIYSLGLLESLAKNNNYQIVAHYFNFLGRSNVDLPDLTGVKYKQSKFVHRKIFNALRRIGLNIPIEVLTGLRFDFAIFPNFISKISLFRTPYTVTVHDFAYIDYSDTVSKRNKRDLERFVPKSIRGARFVQCISFAMANELEKHYPRLAKKIIVTHIPAASAIRTDKDASVNILKKFGIAKKYVLFIGNKEPRKNINNLLKAYGLLNEAVKNKNHLVIVGAKGWNEGIDIRLLNNLGSRVVSTGYVSDVEKAVLISHSSLMIVPSLYEGFGIPIAEAFSYGTPLAVSDIPVFREVAGNNAAYFNPHNVHDMKRVIAKSLSDLHPSKPHLTETWGDISRKIIKEIDLCV